MRNLLRRNPSVSANLCRFFLFVLLIVCALQPTSLSAAPDLVAAYSFNEGTGTTVADSSGTGNNGTLSNTTWTPSGKFGHALVFNGNSLVNIPDSPSLRLTNGMTLEAWVNPSTLHIEWEDVLYKGDDNYYLSATSYNGGRPAGG